MGDCLTLVLFLLLCGRLGLSVIVAFPGHTHRFHRGKLCNTFLKIPYGFQGLQINEKPQYSRTYQVLVNPGYLHEPSPRQHIWTIHKGHGYWYLLHYVYSLSVSLHAWLTSGATSGSTIDLDKKNFSES